MGAERVREARLQTFMSEFDRLKMKDGEKIDDFVGKISEISAKSTALGATIEEPKLVKKILSSIPRKKYIHIVASLEQVLDLNTTTFEDIIGRLKVYEEELKTKKKKHIINKSLCMRIQRISLLSRTQIATIMAIIEVADVEDVITIGAEDEDVTTINTTRMTLTCQRSLVTAATKTVTSHHHVLTICSSCRKQLNLRKSTPKKLKS